MVDERRAHARKLMEQSAFISNPREGGWSPIVVLDVTINAISFACAEPLQGGHIYALRLTVPGSDKLHFVSAIVLPGTTEGVPSGFRYGARFAKIKHGTTEDIINFLSNPMLAGPN